VPDGKLYKCDCTDIISDIYETLLKDGVPPEDIAMCRGENNCVAGNREVIGYLYEHLDKYEGLLVGRTPFIAPWSLSDHDPKTPFDELARAKAKALIERAVQGTAKELNEADRRLAEVKGIYEESLNDPFFFKEMSPTMPKEGEDPKFAKLGCPGKEFVKEESALEFLETKAGTCTEVTKVMMALYTAAGYNSRAIDVTVLEDGQWISHMALQVEVAGGQWVIVDASLKKFAPVYRAFKPLTAAEFAGYHYSQLLIGRPDDNDNEWKARFLYPAAQFIDAANREFDNGRFEEGRKILRAVFTDPQDARPEFCQLLYLKKKNDMPAYDVLIKEVRRKYPEVVNRLAEYLTYFMAAAYFNQNERFIEILKDLSETKEDRMTVMRMEASYYIHTGQFAKARPIMDELAAADGTGSQELSELNAYSLCRQGDFDGYFAFLNDAASRFPDSLTIGSYLFTASLGLERYETAANIGDALMNKVNFPPIAVWNLALAHANTGELDKASSLLDGLIGTKEIDGDKEMKSLFLSLRALISLAKDGPDEFSRYRQQEGSDSDSIVAIIMSIELVARVL
jgi:hypothetical protein